MLAFFIDIAFWRDMIQACFFQGQTINDIPPEVLIDCAQLVKNNSIQGKDVHPIMFYVEQWLCWFSVHSLFLHVVNNGNGHSHLLRCVFYFLSGCKMNNISVVYTPWANLKKTGEMDVGQIGFHRQKDVSDRLLFHSVNLSLSLWGWVKLICIVLWSMHRLRQWQ